MSYIAWPMSYTAQNDGSIVSMGVIHLTDVAKILCKDSDKFLVPSQPVKISTLTISVYFNVVT